jgi:D-serine dehydratase
MDGVTSAPKRVELGALGDLPLDGTTKGVPPGVAGLTLGAIGTQGWNLLAGDLPLPAAVIRKAAVESNSRWMRAFTEGAGLAFAPHGKTTMAPQLFDLQLADGAWAITVGTVHQMVVARRFGIDRILLANQPVGRVAVDTICRALAEDPGFRFYCLVDSLEGAALLAAGARRAGLARPITVFLEVGYPGGRTGVRGRAAALDLARAIAAEPALALVGIECFEGLLGDIAAVDALIGEITAVAREAAAAGLFHADHPIVLSAGGSAFFDRVAAGLTAVGFGARVMTLSRSGCYITHDSLGYEQSYRRMRAEGRVALPDGDPRPALEVWAYVQSRPEPGKAIMTMGKRDVGFDLGLPVPLTWSRDGRAPVPVPMGCAVTGLNDQHCHLAIPDDAPFRVGDMVGFGIGHPCTTFDRWQVLMLVNEDYDVVGAIRTFF